MLPEAPREAMSWTLDLSKVSSAGDRPEFRKFRGESQAAHLRATQMPLLLPRHRCRPEALPLLQASAQTFFEGFPLNGLLGYRDVDFARWAAEGPDDCLGL